MTENTLKRNEDNWLFSYLTFGYHNYYNESSFESCSSLSNYNFKLQWIIAKPKYLFSVMKWNKFRVSLSLEWPISISCHSLKFQGCITPWIKLNSWVIVVFLFRRLIMSCLMKVKQIELQTMAFETKNSKLILQHPKQNISTINHLQICLMIFVNKFEITVEILCFWP